MFADLNILIDINGVFTGPNMSTIFPILFLFLSKTNAPAGGVLSEITISLPEFAICEVFPKTFIKNQFIKYTCNYLSYVIYKLLVNIIYN